MRSFFILRFAADSLAFAGLGLLFELLNYSTLALARSSSWYFISFCCCIC